MSYEPTADATTLAPMPTMSAATASGCAVVVLGLAAAGIAFSGTRDGWVVADRPAEPVNLAMSATLTDPAWDIELPEGPTWNSSRPRA